MRKKNKKARKEQSKSAQRATVAVATAPPPAATAAAKTPATPSGTPVIDLSTQTTDPTVSGVPTDFKIALVHLQEDLYLFLRSNIASFMDKDTKAIIQARCLAHESSNDLKGLDRIAIGKHYSWHQIKTDTYNLCCARVVPGFYFLPFYTTLRSNGTIVAQWCAVIETIHANLVGFTPDWGAHFPSAAP